jgi:hypothetical protein
VSYGDVELRWSYGDSALNFYIQELRVTVTVHLTFTFKTDKVAEWPADGGKGAKERRREDCLPPSARFAIKTLCAFAVDAPRRLTARTPTGCAKFSVTPSPLDRNIGKP